MGGIFTHFRAPVYPADASPPLIREDGLPDGEDVRSGFELRGTALW